MRDSDHRRLTTEAATQLLGFERRQVFRLLKAHRTEGATGLFSKQHGKPEEALAIIRGQYWDLGPTLAAEKLREGHGIALGRETLRKWASPTGVARSQAALEACSPAPCSARPPRSRLH